MSETEKLLQEAQKIAQRMFGAPSESTVMDLFHELCAERDLGDLPPDNRNGVTLQ